MIERNEADIHFVTALQWRKTYRMAKKLLTFIVSLVLTMSLTPLGLAFADSPSNSFSHSFTAVGIRPVLACPQGIVYEQMDVIWYANDNSCVGSAFTENGKRYAITDGHVRHLKDRLIKQINAEYPSYLLLEDDLEFGDPYFEFEKYGYPFQSIVANAVLSNNGKHVASVGSSSDGGSIFLDHAVQGWFEPGSIVHVTVEPFEGYELVADSLTVSCLDAGQQSVVPVDEDFNFVMPNSCVIVNAGFELVAPVDPDSDPLPDDPDSLDPVEPQPTIPNSSPSEPATTPEPDNSVTSPGAKPELIDKVEQVAEEPRSEAVVPMIDTRIDPLVENRLATTYEPEIESRVDVDAETNKEPSTLATALNSAVANIADNIKPVFSDGEVALATLVQGAMAVVGVGCVGCAAIALFKPR